MENRTVTLSTIDLREKRADFPILERQVRTGVPLVYLDSAATSQKPKVVIEAMDEYYRKSNANIHRGIHVLAEEATAQYEKSRALIAHFINSPSSKQIVFTRNTTEAINLVAYSWGRTNLKEDDVVLLTEMEHHSNLVPWQILSSSIGTKLEFIPVTDDGLLDDEVFHKKLELKPKLVAFTQMSNVLGTINPAKYMIAEAHKSGALVLLDGAQSVPHFPVDVQDLDVDFLAFSGHKMCGPTGIGVLYAKRNLLEKMPPFLGGGDMIKRVYLQEFTANEIPYKFEAGTPAIAEAIGLGVAVEYLKSIGMETIAHHEQKLIDYAIKKIGAIDGVNIYGPTAEKKGGVLSFTLTGVHPHDISQILDRYGIAIRAGHHCAMPLHDRYQLSATARASFYFYNTIEEIDCLADAIYQVKDIFGA